MITGMPRIAIAVRDLDLAADTFRNAFAMPVTEVSQRGGSETPRPRSGH